jgi:hypothetical protein
VAYIAVGRLAEGHAFNTGTWSIKVSEHALGRLFQRAPDCDPVSVVYQAHATALALTPDEFDGDRLDRECAFDLSAGPGVFRAALHAGRFLGSGDAGVLLYLHTWISLDQLTRPIERLAAAVRLLGCTGCYQRRCARSCNCQMEPACCGRGTASRPC